MPTQKLTNEIITAAIDGYEAQKTRIDAKIAELRAMLSGEPSEPAATLDASPRKRRNLSAAARKRIGDAQRKRWAASKGQSEPPTPAEAPKPKRRMSAAGRKAVSEATKKRWAAFHAAKQATSKPAAAKKAAPKKVAKAAVKRTPLKASKKASVKKAPVKAAKKAQVTASTPAVEQTAG